MIAQPLFKKPAAAAASTDSYQRPADWLALPDVSASEQIVGLHAVWDNDSNFCAFTASGNYTVDWGDGSAPEIFSAGTAAEHIYDFADLPSSTLTSRGYRQAIIKITPQAGQTFTAFSLNSKHSQSGLVSAYTTGWLDLTLNTPNMGSLRIASAANLSRSRLLELVTIYAIGTGDLYQCFNFFSGLQKVVFPSGFSRDAGCALAFEECRSLKQAPEISGSPTSLNRMFQNCTALSFVPAYNTSNATDAGAMFSGCAALTEVPAMDFSSVTSLTNTFNGCTSLSRVRVTGINATVSFANCKLSAAALDEIYTNLSSTGSGKTITVTGNFGTAADNPAIATAKGWTVTG